MTDVRDRSIDERNREFWDELCSSSVARHLGVTDASPASLERFDDWYFAFYPYLDRHIPYAELHGKRVLEVGLGYGSVAQHLAQAGADYVGLDIAEGPVAMANHRFRQNGLAGTAVQGNILDCSFRDESFDYVVAIGSYHHTGNLQRALDETYRILKPGGTLVLMVYNAYSYRRWLRHFPATFKYWAWDYLGIGIVDKATIAGRAAYDVNTKGEAAPETVFVSRRQLRRMAARFRDFTGSLENIGDEGPLRFFKRKTKLKKWGRFVGLDIYARMAK